VLRNYQINSLIGAVCFTLFTGTAAANSEISLDAEYWHPQVSGKIKSSTNLNLKNDLGLDKTNIANLSLNLKGDKNFKYFIKYEKPSFNDSKTLSHSFSFNGGNYAAGDRITSDLDAKHLQFGIRNEKITSNGKFSTIYSYNHNSIHTGIKNITQNFNKSNNSTSDSLSLGLGWESLNTSGVNFFAEATPLSIGRRGSYLDYNVGIRTKFSKTTAFTLGYKGEKLKVGETSNSDGTTVKLKGIYAFLGSSL